MPPVYDIGVIGAGAAGLTVAAGAAQLGANVLLIEKEPELGGECLHYGCVPSKTLIRTAASYYQVARFPELGLPSVTLPKVDFSKIAQRIRSVIATIKQHDSVEHFRSLGVGVLTGTPEFVDEYSIRMEGKHIAAKNWVLATGSSSANTFVRGVAGTPVLTNRDIFFLENLPESLIVLGGGTIAVEMAQAFNRLGSEVTVVQRSGRILSREDEDMSELIRVKLESEGVRFILGAHVERVRDLGRSREVVVTANGEQNILYAEAVFVAMGRKPNLDGLALENTGIAYDGYGVKVDERMRTSQKHIYAAGDVTGQYQFTHAAGYEAGIVVANAISRQARKVSYKLIPWCSFTDPELAIIGLNETAAKAKGIAYEVHTEPFVDHDRAQSEVLVEGQIKLLLDSRERPLGVQVCGPHAGDLLSEWVAVMNGDVKLVTMSGAVHPYPTLAEINKRVVENVLGPTVCSDKMQKLLKFFFSFKGRECSPSGDGIV